VENGKLVLRKDVYDYDGKVLAAIGGKTVQEAGEKTQGSFRRAAMRFPQRFRYYDRPSYYRPRFESSSRWWW
jgi:hypothetical protein